MSRWRDALDCQLDVLREWQARDGDTPYEELSPEEINARFEDWRLAYEATGEFESKHVQHTQRQIVLAALGMAEPVWIAPHVVDLVEAAEPSFEDEPLLPWDALTPMGFALLGRPIQVSNTRGEHPLRALCWAPIGVAEDGQSGVMWIGHFEDAPASRSGVVAFSQSLWDIGRRPEDLGGRNPPVPEGEHYVDNLARYRMERLTQVLWRLSKQLVRTRERSSRAVRRAAARMNVAHEDVLVVKLRKGAPPVEEGVDNPVDWQCQWVVRGHWREQWYPSLDTHRQIWVAPYLKGPEDKPLRPVVVRAHEFVR